jgi:Helix-turn-helix of DDE superfamily endonuclease
MTGLDRDQVDDLVLQLAGHGLWSVRRRRALDPHRSVLVVLLYLRHNLSQHLLAELFGCSQATISRLVTLLIPILTQLLTPWPTGSPNVSCARPCASTGSWRRSVTAPSLRRTITHARHKTSLRKTLSRNAWNRRPGSALAARYSACCKARTGSRVDPSAVELA